MLSWSRCLFSSISNFQILVYFSISNIKSIVLLIDSNFDWKQLKILVEKGNPSTQEFTIEYSICFRLNHIFESQLNVYYWFFKRFDWRTQTNFCRLSFVCWLNELSVELVCSFTLQFNKYQYLNTISICLTFVYSFNNLNRWNFWLFNLNFESFILSQLFQLVFIHNIVNNNCKVIWREIGLFPVTLPTQISKQPTKVNLIPFYVKITIDVVCIYVQ